MRAAFTLRGQPIPQGSLTANKRGEGIHHVRGTDLAVWRASVGIAARTAGILQPSPLPIRLSVQFGMRRPKAHLQLRGGRYVVKMEYYYARPAVAPDLDKLVRGVSDALSGVAYFDDGQIVELFASKVYADETYIEVTDEGLTAQQEAFTAQVSAGLGVNSQKDSGS
jgi:Holliday junction resolvase RusA-like endonuclease